MIIDGCAGPGGWEEGLKLLGVEQEVLGLELERVACATATAAGHRRVQIDVSMVDPRRYAEVDGVIFSPPCPSFSTAGKQKGTKQSGLILEGLQGVETYGDVCRLIDRLRPKMTDQRTLLVLEPLRYVLGCWPRWFAFEQVPAVHAVWEEFARILGLSGYAIDVDIMNSEQYGVPQTRKRTIVIGRNDADYVFLPSPTNSRFHSWNREKRDTGVPLWRSMRDELHIPMSWQFVGAGAASVYTAGVKPRNSFEPSHTITGAGSAAWIERGESFIRRASTTELAVLQTFPADYPFAGNQGQVHQQIGDAIPPRMAAAVLSSLVKRQRNYIKSAA